MGIRRRKEREEK